MSAAPEVVPQLMTDEPQDVVIDDPPPTYRVIPNPPRVEPPTIYLPTAPPKPYVHRYEPGQTSPYSSSSAHRER